MVQVSLIFVQSFFLIFLVYFIYGMVWYGILYLKIMETR